MKKLFTLIALIALAFNAQAVRHCNLVIIGGALTNGNAYHDSAAVPFIISVKNLGPDSIKASDSIAFFLISWDPYTYSLNSPGNFAFITNRVMHVGDTLSVVDTSATSGALLNLYNWHWAHDSTHPVCLLVTGYNHSTDSVAADTATARQSCVQNVTYLDLHQVAISQGGLKVYPNPAQSDLNFDINLNRSGNLSVIITDMFGRAVLTENEGMSDAGYHNINFNTSGLANGMYIYRVLVDGEATTGKINIMK